MRGNKEEDFYFTEMVKFMRGSWTLNLMHFNFLFVNFRF